MKERLETEAKEEYRRRMAKLLLRLKKTKEKSTDVEVEGFVERSTQVF